MIALTLVNAGPYAVSDQPVRTGVPLPVGQLHDLAGVQLQPDTEPRADSGGWAGIASSDFTVLTRWHDGSIKWLLVEALVSAAANSSARINLMLDAAAPAPSTPIELHRKGDRLEVRTLHAVYRFDAATGGPFPDIEVNGQPLWHDDSAQVVLRDASGRQLAWRTTALRAEGGNERHRAAIEVEGEYRDVDARLVLRSTWRFSCYHERALLGIECELHNPAAASHPGGLWDLGDPGSFEFSELALALPVHESASCSLRLTAGGDWLDLRTADFRLLQGTSGSALKASPVHVMADGTLPDSIDGYALELGGDRLASGERASPVLQIDGTQGAGVLIAPEQFWENFPGALERNDNHCALGLFPTQYGHRFELQGGEKKTHRMTLDFSGERNALDWLECPALLQVPTSHWCDSRVLRYTDATGPVTQNAGEPAAYDAFIARVIDDATGFKARRELIDEFGWRHFGDLYADHETWNRSDTGVFVSHYNNQYDPIQGFARQFALSGDARWQELMIDLARHVLDIDLYATELDRAEYNGGLFWHTDHYLPAATCSHRTYSREHPGNGADGRSQGGGPGGEHCYTSGLASYYHLTGDPRGRAAVFRLAQWIGCFYEGDGTVLEQARRLASRDARRLIRACRTGSRRVYTYPLDRGVGNYINALLDCHELSQHDPALAPGTAAGYLQRVEQIISNTIGPDDVLAERQFEDIENTWFYTIFLQALIRYLDVKREIGELDAAFAHAHATLLHYAHWMLEHEKPYLENAAHLEFPNETWVAQDIRKCMILQAAWRYRTDDREAYRLAALAYRDYVISTLQAASQGDYTRILVILLQNHGPHACLQPERPPELQASELPVYDRAGRRHAAIDTSLTLARQWLRALRGLSLRAERHWLRLRLAR